MTTKLNIPTEALVVGAAGAEFKMTPIVLADMNEDEVLVEMKYSGICHTDIVLQKGLLPQVGFPAIFGHEGAGIVLRVGNAAAASDPNLKPGATVLLSFNTCGTCRQCTAEKPWQCHVHPDANARCVRLSDGSTPARLASNDMPVRSQCFGQSSFSRISVVAGRSVVVIPEGLLDGAAASVDREGALATYAPLGCGFQTGAGTVLNILKPQPDQSLVVFGMGSVGLTALMAASYLGVKQLVAVDVVEEKLAVAREFGASHTVNSKHLNDVAAEIVSITGGGVDYAIDCTGAIPVIESLVGCLRPAGTAASVGVPAPGKKVQIDALPFLLDNKSFIGVIEGGSLPQRFIPRLIELHRQGCFPIHKLCTVYPVEEFDQALSDLRTGKVIKPIIKWT